MMTSGGYWSRNGQKGRDNQHERELAVWEIESLVGNYSLGREDREKTALEK